MLAQLQASGHVYPCYMSMAELDALRERQTAAKEKAALRRYLAPRAWQKLPPVPEGVQPVLRFKTPQGRRGGMG